MRFLLLLEKKNYPEFLRYLYILNFEFIINTQYTLIPHLHVIQWRSMKKRGEMETPFSLVYTICIISFTACTFFLSILIITIICSYFYFLKKNIIFYRPIMYLLYQGEIEKIRLDDLIRKSYSRLISGKYFKRHINS